MIHVQLSRTVGHVRKECKHGVMVSTCRCPSSNKTVEIVACPTHCTAAQEYTPRHAAPDEK